MILQTDHQALLPAPKENRGNKTYQSILTCWIDQLLPFQFTVEHIPGIPGKNMGLANYLGRNLTGIVPNSSAEDNNFVIKTMREITFALIKSDLTPNGANAYSVDAKQVNSDVINRNPTRSEQNNAFCFNTQKIQSHPLNTILVNSIKSDSQKDKNVVTYPCDTEIVAITTLKNPTKETFLFPINKRFCVPNKHNTLQMDTLKSSPKHKLIPALK